MLLTVAEDTAWFTLNRPAVHNALSINLSEKLIETVRTIKASTDIKFVVIKGAVQSFCVGDDITEMPLWGNDEHGDSTQGPTV